MICVSGYDVLVFILVSTPATYSHAVPKGLPVLRHECEGKTLCDIKPAGYPQEEIDAMALKHLPLLQRMKREAGFDSLELQTSTAGGNCHATRSVVKLFTYCNGSVPIPIVQSKWFNQTVSDVTCLKVNEKSCFSSFIHGYSTAKTKCETKKSYTYLTYYNIATKKPESVETWIGVDCACEFDNSLNV